MGLLPAFFSSSGAVMNSQVNYVLFHGINRSWGEAAVSKSLLVAVVCSKNCYHPSKPSLCGLFLPSAFLCSSVTSANSDGDSFTRSQRDISLNICLAMKIPVFFLVFLGFTDSGHRSFCLSSTCEGGAVGVDASMVLIRQMSILGRCQIFSSRLGWSYLVNTAQEYRGFMLLSCST